MARPIQLKAGGAFYLKERLPSDLTKLRGQTVDLPIGEIYAKVTVGEFVQTSLRTKIEREARERHAQADSALRSYWDAQRRGPLALTYKQAVAFAGDFYRSLVAEHEDDPGEALRWHNAELRSAIARIAGFDPSETGLSIQVDPLPGAGQAERALATLYSEPISALLQRKGLVVDDASHSALLHEVGKAFEKAAARLKRHAEGDYRPDPQAERFPAWVQPNVAATEQGSRRNNGSPTVADLEH